MSRSEIADDQRALQLGEDIDHVAESPPLIAMVEGPTPAREHAGLWRNGVSFFAASHPRLALAKLLSALFPTFVGGCAVRARMYRWAGFRLGPGVAIVGTLSLISSYPGFYDKLVVGGGSTIGHHVTISLDDTVTIGQRVLISPHVMIYTGNHKVGPGSMRASMDLTTAPVVVEDGAWIRVGALILPGVVVGHGAIVGEGAIVTRDVPPNTYVEGNPAKVVHRLPWGDR